MQEEPGLIRVYVNDDHDTPAKGQPLRAGISGAAAKQALSEANGPGSLKDPFGVFVSADDVNLPPGVYSFYPASAGKRRKLNRIT